MLRWRTESNISDDSFHHKLLVRVVALGGVIPLVLFTRVVVLHLLKTFVSIDVFKLVSTFLISRLTFSRRLLVSVVISLSDLLCI